MEIFCPPEASVLLASYAVQAKVKLFNVFQHLIQNTFCVKKFSKRLQVALKLDAVNVHVVQVDCDSILGKCLCSKGVTSNV